MSRRKQLLVILIVHLIAALAMWDGYRLGLKQGRAERLRPQTSIIVDPDPPTLPEPPAEPPERTDVNWRGN